MTTDKDALDPARDLQITRLLNAPREKVWRCWTEAEHLVKWFAPKPWTTPYAKLDVRPGGAQIVTMRSPEGQDYPTNGLYLEVIPNEKLVWTDAYTGAWIPSAKPFFTAILTFADEDGKTRYTATARHWNADDTQTHAKMGFDGGWNQCATQLEEIAAGL
jgi:uncharacterized protein YndB with AHSA1/START domain